MNDKLQRVYYILGIIQKIVMIILTFLMMGAAYKIYELSVRYGKLFEMYGIEIKEMHRLIEVIRLMLHKSIFF
jgi:hypothetical protein